MNKVGLAAMFAAFGTVGTVAEAATIANCGAASGWAYYAQSGLVGAAQAGWGKSEITGGRTTLSFSSTGGFDVLFVDATGAISSAKAEGATVSPIRFGASEIAVMIWYPGATFEVYSFVRDSTGKAQLLTLQSRGPDSLFTNATVMVASCEMLDLPKLRKLTSGADPTTVTDEEAAAAADAAAAARVK